MTTNRKPIIIPVCGCISDHYTIINNTPSLLHLKEDIEFNTLYDFIQNTKTLIPIVSKFDRSKSNIIKYVLSKKLPLVLTTHSLVPYQLIDMMKDVQHAGFTLDIQKLSGVCLGNNTDTFNNVKEVIRQYMIARANRMFVSANMGNIHSTKELVDYLECLELFKNAVTCVFANIDDARVKSIFTAYCTQRKIVPYIFDIGSNVCDSENCLLDYKPFIYENDGCSFFKTYEMNPYECSTCGSIELPIISQLQL